MGENKLDQNNQSAMMGLVVGLGIVIAFLIIMLMVDNTKPEQSTNSIAQPGKAIYDKSCANCHEAGVLNAPKLGDKQAWELRLVQGEAALVQSAINGFNTIT